MNYHLTNPNFLKNLEKTVKQKKLQYAEIEEFDSDEDDKNKKEEAKMKQKEREKEKEREKNKPVINNLEEKDDSD